MSYVLKSQDNLVRRVILLDFYKIPVPLVFIFIILHFIFFAKQFLPEDFSYWRVGVGGGGVLIGQCSLPGLSWKKKFRGNVPGNIFQEEA